MKRKVIFCFIFIFILGFSMGCAKELEEMEVADDDIFTEGTLLMRESVANVEIKDYKISMDSEFFVKYKNAKLTNIQQAYYDILVKSTKDYNKFKETGETKYLKSSNEGINEITKLLKANTKKE
ncbi:hypothetical protein Amet_2834 [Alkaliphilus metalliredigens QYMF]|uniref:DUF4296 domain-containing protein n=1 Tax=Alkaliphilus metalliredigens (strain QYMF) TaxID=293826 RepID=A6TS16_ALKMQ|nr:hypothetical protein [Alkaliphilus metalliredigens]ABR48984.1 hypothetical protein Amet_2834 [Alkaliphilus metalliredigens QYMF]